MPSHIETFWYLLVAHAFSDYVFQPPHMGEQKNPWHQGKLTLGPWWWTMGAHGLINGGLVSLVTGKVSLGIAELVLHTSMDTVKCAMIAWSRGERNTVKLWTWVDQGVHLMSKLLWAVLA